jgi:hypothetical protein
LRKRELFIPKVASRGNEKHRGTVPAPGFPLAPLLMGEKRGKDKEKWSIGGDAEVVRKEKIKVGRECRTWTQKSWPQTKD